MTVASTPSPADSRFGRRDAVVLGLSLAAVAAVAGIGGSATASSVDTWYRTLERPPWSPPNWLFGPVWTVLYAAQAVAAWLVWRSGGPQAASALRVYGAQLVLNLGWSLIFFGLRRPGLALIEIAVLWVAIVATVVAFRRRSKLAALLLVPYLLWVSYAVTLNAGIWWRNR